MDAYYSLAISLTAEERIDAPRHSSPPPSFALLRSLCVMASRLPPAALVGEAPKNASLIVRALHVAASAAAPTPAQINSSATGVVVVPSIRSAAKTPLMAVDGDDSAEKKNAGGLLFLFESDIES